MIRKPCTRRRAPSQLAGGGEGADRRNLPGRPPRARKRDEDNLQIGVVKFLRFAAPDLIFFHPTNEAGSRSKGEMGRLNAMGLVAGVHDLVFCLDAGRFAAIELKAGTPETAAQRAWGGAVERKGGLRATCRSIEEVESTLRAWGVPLRGTVLPTGAFLRQPT